MRVQAHNFDDIAPMADDVSRLVAARFGGAGRGEDPCLSMMLRRRGAALPRGLRKRAQRLAQADMLAAQPRVARQLDVTGLARDHAALVSFLQPLGSLGRWQARAVSLSASLALGLLVLGATVVWIMVRRGLI